MKLDEKTQAILNDFNKWVDDAEEKYELNAVDIYTEVRRFLNRFERQCKRNIEKVESMSDEELAEIMAKMPKKYRTADWLLGKVKESIITGNTKTIL